MIIDLITNSIHIAWSDNCPCCGCKMAQGNKFCSYKCYKEYKDIENTYISDGKNLEEKKRDVSNVT